VGTRKTNGGGRGGHFGLQGGGPVEAKMGVLGIFWAIFTTSKYGDPGPLKMALRFRGLEEGPGGLEKQGGGSGAPFRTLRKVSLRV